MRGIERLRRGGLLLVWSVGFALVVGEGWSEVPLRFSEPSPHTSVSGVCPVRIEGKPATQEFSVLLYVDQRWVFATTALPCQYEWDTSVLLPGLHTLQAEIYWQGKLQYRTDPLTIQVVRPGPLPGVPNVPTMVQEEGLRIAADAPSTARTTPAAPPGPPASVPSPSSAPVSPRPASSLLLAGPALESPLVAVALPKPSLSPVGLLVARSRRGLMLQWQGQPVGVSLRWVRPLSLVYAPVRSLMEVLGGGVTWENGAKRVHLRHGGQEANIQVGHAVAYRAGEAIQLPGPLQLRSRRTWIAVRSLESLYRLPVEWRILEL